MNEVNQKHEREPVLASDGSVSLIFINMSLSTFRVYITLYFLVLCVVFLLAFKVVYGIDLGSLSLEKIQTYDDEKYIVSITQEQIFNDTNKYDFIPEYDCGNYKCMVHEYLAPPYTDNDRGYILYMNTGEEIITEATGKLKPYLDGIITLDILIATSTEK